MSLKEIKKPFNLLMFIIAIVSLSLMVFFYFTSQKVRRPMYQIIKPYSIVYDSSVSSPKISILDSSGNVINNDIYLITISFWNAGNLPIEPQDIRIPVILHIKPIIHILDFSIITQTDPTIVRFNLSEIPQYPSSNEGQLLLSWTHLDPGEGARFQIIYSGQKDAVISFSGNILDVHEISKISSSSKILPQYDTAAKIVVLIETLLLLGFLLFNNKIRINDDIVILKRTKIIFLIMMTLAVAMTIFTIMVFITAKKPPF